MAIVLLLKLYDNVLSLEYLKIKEQREILTRPKYLLRDSLNFYHK